MSSSDAPESRLLRHWRSLSRLPGGRRLFGFLVGRTAPYTGTIHPRVLELRPGYARVAMADRPAHRNHLRSLHAVALLNLAEVCSGLAMLAALPPEARGIVVDLGMEYRKKARGPIVAECRCPADLGCEERELELEAWLRDSEEEVVAVGRARWRLGPRQEGRA